MKKFRFQKALRWLTMFLIVFYQFTPLSNNINVVHAALDPTLTFVLGTGNGTVEGYSFSTPTSVAVETSLSLTATPATGYEFSSWSFSPTGGGEATSSTDNPKSYVMPGVNTTITVNFTPISYTLDFSVEPSESGSIEGRRNDTAVEIQTGASIPYGTSITLTAKPEIGYIIGEWGNKPSGATEGQDGSNGTLTFTMPSANTTVGMKMAECSNNLIFSVNPSGSGTITSYKNHDPSTNIPSGSSIKVRTPMTITATPATGYKFDKWGFDPSGEGSKPNYITSDVDTNTLSLTMPDSQVTVTAHFVRENYTLDFSINPEGSGTTEGYNNTLNQSITSGTSITFGDSITLTSIPGIGYVPNGWTASPRLGDGLFTTNTLSFTMPANNVTATADMNECHPPLTLAVDPSGSGIIKAYRDGNISEEVTSGEDVRARSPLTITATPATGYEFDKWGFSVGGDKPSYATSNTEGTDGVYVLSLTMPEEAVTVTAHFKMINYNLTLGVDPSEGGIIKDADGNTVELGSLSYNMDSKINFTAEPKSGYKFKQWLGNYVDAINTKNIQFNMPNSDIILTAVFEKDNTVTTTVDSQQTTTSVPQTSDDINIYPFIITMMLSGALCLMLKIPTRKTAKKCR